MLEQLLQHCDLDKNFGNESFPENYYPIPNNYIVFQTGSEKQSQIYPLYFEVIGHLRQSLNLFDIVPIQVGDPTDPIVPNTLDLRGILSVRQLAYVIKNARVCISSHSFANKLARVYDVPLVWIGCNFPRNKETKIIKRCSYIEPDIGDKKWNYRNEDSERTILGVKPEIVASEILKWLKLDHVEFPKTQYIGKHYGSQIFDFVPDSFFPQELMGKVINFRLDLFHNEQNLFEISNHCQLHIVTKYPFDLNNLNARNVISITYFCDKNVDVEFVKLAASRGAKMSLVCDIEEDIAGVRFKLLDVATVFKRKEEKPFDKMDFCASMFRSSRTIVGRNKVYSSVYHYKKDLAGNFASGQKLTDDCRNDPDFLEFSDFYYIFQS